MATQSMILTQLILRSSHIVQLQQMSELIVLLHKVKVRDNRGVCLEAVLPDGKHDLHHVLHTLVELSFVQNGAQTFKDRCTAVRKSSM